jgi:hypothetical protein
MSRSIPIVVVCFVLSFLLLLSACNLNAPTPTPPPTPDLPAVSFIYPQNGSQVFEGVDMSVDIFAQDPANGISRIEFLVDNEKINEGAPESGTVPEFRVTMNWVASGLGKHTLSSIAYRVDGTPSDEAIITIEVIARPND